VLQACLFNKTVAEKKGGEFGVKMLSLITNIAARRHFPKLQWSHLAYTMLAEVNLSLNMNLINVCKLKTLLVHLTFENPFKENNSVLHQKIPFGWHTAFGLV